MPPDITNPSLFRRPHVSMVRQQSTDIARVKQKSEKEATALRTGKFASKSLELSLRGEIRLA